MSNIRFILLLTVIGSYSLCLAQPELNSKIQVALPNFEVFSKTLILHSAFNIGNLEKGPLISVPFGVGYTLANMNVLIDTLEKITSGSDEDFQLALKSAVQDYSTLVHLLDAANVTTWSGIFLRRNDNSIRLLKSSDNIKKLQTEVRNLQPSPQAANKLSPASLSFTTSTLINLNHYKGIWKEKGNPVEVYLEGTNVPFLQMKVPVLETNDFSAAAVPLKGDDYLVFVQLKENASAYFTQGTSWIAGYPSETWLASKPREILVPILNLTVTQQFMKLKDLGIPDRVCPDDAFTKSEQQPAGTIRDSYFAGPIVQSNKLILNSQAFEIQSETGGSILSGAKLNKFLIEKGSFAKFFSESFDVTLDPPNPVPGHEPRKPGNNSDEKRLVFSGPFAWYLATNSIGPLYYGGIDSTKSYKTDSHVEPGREGWSAASKAKLSFCEQLFKA